VIGVVGARGGAGATVVAALLAAALARRGPGALVELGAGPAIDAVLGTEHAEGARWPDLAGARGAVDPDDLTDCLPRWTGCAVLGHDPCRPGPPPPVTVDVLHALRAAHAWTVVDLGRLGSARDPVLDVPAEVVPICDLLLLVVPRDVPSVVAARTGRAALRSLGPPVVAVVRGPAPGGLGVGEVATAVGLPLLGALPTCRSIAAAVDRGLGPLDGRRHRAAVERMARRLGRWAR
jgi:secretion/DNA translocation related CpaE-like protein